MKCDIKYVLELTEQEAIVLGKLCGNINLPMLKEIGLGTEERELVSIIWANMPSKEEE